MQTSLNRIALMATLHCLAGCAVGEVLGMVLGGLFHWHGGATVALSIVLAFIFGYSFTLIPLIRTGMAVRSALALAFASDTISISIMEVIDNLLMVGIPGAMHAGPATGLFWGSMTVALIAAGAAAFPVNRWLIAKGRGHAVIHAHHGGRAQEPGEQHHRATGGERERHHDLHAGHR